MPLGAVVPASDLPIVPDASATPAPIIPGFAVEGRDAKGIPIMAPSAKGSKLGGVVPAEDLPGLSSLPGVTDPLNPGPGIKQGLKNMVSDITPHTPTQAALMATGLALPLVGPGLDVAEDAGFAIPGMVSRAAAELGSGGLKGAALRTGLQSGIGAATGGKEGAVEGAEVGVAGEALPAIAGKVAGLGIANRAAAGQMQQTAIDAATKTATDAQAAELAAHTSATDMVTQRALENELGMTAADAQGLAKPSAIGDASGAQALAGTKQAAGAVRRGAIREVGDKYNPIFEPIQAKPASPSSLADLSKAATDANQFAASKGARLAPQTQKILNDLQGMGAALGAGEDPVKILLQRNSEVGPEALANMGNNALEAYRQGFIKQGLLNPDGTLPGAQMPAQTIGMLRGKLGEAMMAANKPGSSAMDRRVLFDATRPIVDTLNAAIPDEQKPLLQQINNEYAQVNRILPFKGQQKLQQAATLPELGAAMFGNESAPATKLTLSRMTEPQKDLARQAFASYVLTDTATPTETLSKLAANKDAVAALYPDSDFGKIGKWRDAMIAQKKFQQGPPNLPSQKQFAEGVQEAIRRSGLTPEAQQAATDALIKSAHGQGRVGRYLTSPFLYAGALGGYGMLHHEPMLIVPLAAYAAGNMGWKALAGNAAAMDTYRQFIMSGWTQKGGEMFGRLVVNAVNDAVRGDAPQMQGVKDVEGPAIDSLHKSRAEAIAPTPSASDRAGEVAKDIRKGKVPKVHDDLDRGRLSLDEVNKLVSPKKDATMLTQNVPLSEQMDAAEVGTPEEKKMLLPLIKQQMMAQFKDQNYNKTLAAGLAKRYQKLAAGGNEGEQGETSQTS